MANKSKQHVLRSFPRNYWLVIMFEFFERGSYYGMMSVLSIYLTDILGFAKTSVGLIKGTIQPILYFLPILSGALADRFGYRRTLTVAFTLLGSGYFLTSQMTSYSAVFLALCVMALGAGTFKPIITGSIARTTDESNSTLGFGIYYWSINLGAFLFPLILVPVLRNVGWRWIIIASALGTGTMLIPTLLLYKEPPRPDQDKTKQLNLIKTVANAFEIIYSPFVLIYHFLRSSRARAILIYGIIVLLLVLAGWNYLNRKPLTETINEATLLENDTALSFSVQRDAMSDNFYLISTAGEKGPVRVTITKPDRFDDFKQTLLDELRSQYPALAQLSDASITGLFERSQKKSLLTIRIKPAEGERRYTIVKDASDNVTLTLHQVDQYDAYKAQLLQELQSYPNLITLSQSSLDQWVNQSQQRSFFLLYILLLFVSSLVILRVQQHYVRSPRAKQLIYNLLSLAAIVIIIWLIPGLNFFSRIVSTIIYFTVLSLYTIEIDDKNKFKDNFRFLLMIFIYSGFWILYFQMFDSVLWYVKAYVDATSLNNFINSIIGTIGIKWSFNVEAVTYINAGTIILLQLVVSNIVKNTKALPTMVAGIALGTIGMAILAISTNIWVFVLGIFIFSIGEMTAHPKFYSYVGLTAPKDRVCR